MDLAARHRRQHANTPRHVRHNRSRKQPLLSKQLMTAVGMSVVSTNNVQAELELVRDNDVYDKECGGDPNLEFLPSVEKVKSTCMHVQYTY